jgi:hypothetical protein
VPSIQIRPNPFGGGYNVQQFGHPDTQIRPAPFGGGFQDLAPSIGDLEVASSARREETRLPKVHFGPRDTIRELGLLAAREPLLAISGA